MKIRQLVRNISELTVRGNRELEITGLSSHSRNVAPGNVFIARKGQNHDGSQYIPQAIQGGAVAIVSDLYDPFLKQTQLISEDPTKIEAKLAANFYQHPSKELFLVGVTGSKGKTTTSYLIHHLLHHLGKSTGLITTIETLFPKNRFPSLFTTHEPIYNQHILREMIRSSCNAAVMEVSSHGLALGRIQEIDFQIGVFTNLFPDHLDFHGTVEEYAKAKRLLFSQVKSKAIWNADSEWTQFMKSGFLGSSFTFGIEKRADLMATKITYSLSHTTFEIGTKAVIQTPLIGRHNVYNLLAAASVGVELGAPFEQIASILSSFQNVPGRLERVLNRRNIHVFVDYAHTGDSLESVLRTLKELSNQKILIVFGCGGNRDPSRRKNMAKAAEKYADLSIVTSDNPRNEPLEEIVRQILSGFERPSEVLVELDRRLAIRKAFAKAKRGDIVLIAGKGHEKTQSFKNQTLPFDDVAVAKEELF